MFKCRFQFHQCFILNTNAFSRFTNAFLSIYQCFLSIHQCFSLNLPMLFSRFINAFYHIHSVLSWIDIVELECG